MNPETISPTDLAEVLAAGDCTLLDVRTPAEFREVHVRGAVNVPLDQLSARNLPQPSDEHTQGEEPIYVICHKGSRGAQAQQRLRSEGVMHVVNVEGGTLACQRADLPTQHGKKTISLERQVRIAAGSLVVLGVGLSLLHPAFLALSAFVGAGLVFAGVTDTCGMGMLLARMPWNQT